MKYVSKCHNLVLTIKPKRTQILEGIVYAVPGEHVRFSNFEYETTDKKVVEWLAQHPLKNTAFSEATIPGAKTPDKEAGKEAATA